VLEAVSSLLPSPLGFAMEPVGGDKACAPRDSLRGSDASLSGVGGAVLYKTSCANSVFFRSRTWSTQPPLSFRSRANFSSAVNARTKTKEAMVAGGGVELARSATQSASSGGDGGEETTSEELVRVIAGIFIEVAVFTKLAQQLFSIGRSKLAEDKAALLDSQGRLSFGQLDPLRELLAWYERAGAAAQSHSG
jgi:hypothetical protein